MTMIFKIFYKDGFYKEVTALGWKDLGEHIEKHGMTESISHVDVYKTPTNHVTADLEEQVKQRALKHAAERATYEVLRGLAEPRWVGKLLDYLNRIEGYLDQIAAITVSNKSKPRKRKRTNRK